MKVTIALIKKNIIGYYRNIKKSLTQSTLSAIVSLLGSALFLALFIYVMMCVVESYSTVMYNGVKDPVERQRELLIYSYTLIMIISIISSIKQFNKFLFYNDDLKIYITLPIKMTSLFASLMSFIYLKQVVSTLIYSVIINVIFVNVAGAPLSTVWLSLLVSLFLPAISIAIAAILSVPVYYIQTTFRNKYLFVLICITAFVGVCFYFYSELLDVFSDMLFTGEIKFFFSKEVMDKIILVANNLYPGVFLANVILQIDLGKNLGIIAGIAVGSLILGALIINGLLSSIIKQKLQPTERVWIKRRPKVKCSSKFNALMKKEYITTIRTPSYLLQYFSTALIMPLMTFACVKLCKEFALNMIGFDCMFEISIFCTFLFTMITNTYSSTNISRDGDAFFILKSYSIKPKEYVAVKVIFCSILSGIATLISSIVIAATGYITAVQGVFVCLSGWAFGLSIICFSTHLDMKHPHFSKEDNGEIKEDNSTSSLITVIGLFVSIIIGGASLIVRIVLGVKGIPSNDLYAYLITGISSVVLCLISSLALWFNADKMYQNIQEGK